jgi:hypothetical protein
VQLFEGTLNEAILEATKLNSKDKLPMTEDDKFDRAWKLVCLESYTIKETANVCGVSDPTISRMRKKLSEFQTEYPIDWRHKVFSLPWKQAMDLNKVVQEYEEEWEFEQGKKWAQRLHNIFGTKLSSQPRAAAIALELYSASLVPSLISEWRAEIKQIYEQEEISAVDRDF